MELESDEILDGELISVCRVDAVLLDERNNRKQIIHHPVPIADYVSGVLWRIPLILVMQILYHSYALPIILITCHSLTWRFEGLER